MKPLLKRDLSWFCDPDGTLTSGLILVIRDLEEGGCCEVIGSARNFNFLLASRTPLLKRKTNNGSEKKKSFVGFLFVSFSTLGDFFFFLARGRDSSHQVLPPGSFSVRCDSNMSCISSPTLPANKSSLKSFFRIAMILLIDRRNRRESFVSNGSCRS